QPASAREREESMVGHELALGARPVALALRARRRTPSLTSGGWPRESRSTRTHRRAEAAPRRPPGLERARRYPTPAGGTARDRRAGAGAAPTPGAGRAPGPRPANGPPPPGGYAPRTPGRRDTPPAGDLPPRGQTGTGAGPALARPPRSSWRARPGPPETDSPRSPRPA